MSEHSSGVVQSGEVLIRVLVAPQHMDKKGRPKAGALTDAERNGLSLLRKSEATPDDIRRVAIGLVESARSRLGPRGSQAGVFGVLEIVCGTIRTSIQENERRPAYGVYDTALHDLTPHAEAFQQVADTDLGLIEARRRHLFTLVQPTFVPVNEFMDGLLSDLAPQA